MKESSKKIVVYVIKEDGIVRYVGKTSNMTKRKWYHLNYRGTHYSAIPLEINLETIVIETVSFFDEDLEALKFEDQLILQYNTIENGWNKLRSGHIKVGDLKEYNRNYLQKFRADNPDKCKEYSKKYYEEHKDECLERSHKYHEEHKDELSVKHKEYRDTHKEDRNLKQREWWEKNKDIINARRREERRLKKMKNNELKR